MRGSKWETKLQNDGICRRSSNYNKRNKHKGRWERVTEECIEWENRKKLKYSVTKTEGWWKPRKKNCRGPRISMGGSRIEMKSEVKNLEVWLDKELSWNKHIIEMRKKTKKIAGKVFGLSRRKRGSSHVFFKKKL